MVHIVWTMLYGEYEIFETFLRLHYWIFYGFGGPLYNSVSKLNSNRSIESTHMFASKVYLFSRFQIQFGRKSFSMPSSFKNSLKISFENLFLYCNFVLALRSIIPILLCHINFRHLVWLHPIHNSLFRLPFSSIYTAIDLALVRLLGNIWLNNYPMASSHPILDMSRYYTLFLEFLFR